MTRFDANEPAQRRALAAEAVIAHRKRASEAAVFQVYSGPDRDESRDETRLDAHADGSEDETGLDADKDEAVEHARSLRLVYAEGVITFECTPRERERLDDLLADFPVFKLQQPATRKAPDGIVHVSAVADPKRAADFVDAAFRRVYELPESYRLWVARV